MQLNQANYTMTSKLGGGFKTDPAARTEFMRMVNLR